MGNSPSNASNNNPHRDQANGPAALSGREKKEAGKAAGKHSASSLSHAPARGAPRPPISSTPAAAPASPSTQLDPSHAHGTAVSASPKRSVRSKQQQQQHPSRARNSVSQPATSRPTPSVTSSAMGNSESKPPQARPPSRANTLPVNDNPAPSRQNTDPDDQVPAPLNVQPPGSDGPSEDDSAVLSPSAYAESPYGAPPPNYSRPPRLPLPIGEEVYTPGSPLLSPQEEGITTPLEQGDVEGGAIPRKTSVLSSTTVDDDDVGDNDAFATEASQWGEIRVPTELRWNGQGEKIFVTGTFCNWEKKMKLHRDKERGGFAATLNLPPGTHHIKFLVDGEMTTSNDLPTTVDWTNILVNYVEIVAPLPSTGEQKQAPEPAKPMPIPGAAMTAGQATGTNEPAARPLTKDMVARAPETHADLPSTLDEVGPKGERLDSEEAVAAPSTEKPSSLSKPEPKPTPAPKPKLPRPKYTTNIPDFLIDLDRYNTPEDERFQRAQRVGNTLPQPPSLPMFLSKSILNGATPHKDDASVLIMPNHTVLNHLATSSIKHGVLATSGTTRYKRKFLTTIMYKPTSDDG